MLDAKPLAEITPNPSDPPSFRDVLNIKKNTKAMILLKTVEKEYESDDSLEDRRRK